MAGFFVFEFTIAGGDFGTGVGKREAEKNLRPLSSKLLFCNNLYRIKTLV